MSREKQLVKNTIIITIGKICTQFISFILLPLYTAILTTEEYGVVDLLNTYVSLLAPIIAFQIEQAVFRFLIDIRNNEEEKKTLIATSLFFGITQSIIFLIVFSIIARWFNNDYKYFLATNVVAAIFSSMMLQISRGLGDNTSYTIGSFITASLNVLLNVIFIVFLKLGAYGMLLASLISNIVCAVFLFIKKKVYRYVSIKKINKTKLKELCKYSIPLIPNSISWWIVNASDRTIVSSALGIGMNGIYSAANKFSSVYITFYNIFNLTWTESVAMYIKDKDADIYISKVINTALKLFFAVGLGIIACMPFIFPIMVNEKFGEAYYQIPILMLSSLCNVVVGLISVIYIAKKLTKEVAKTSIIAAIINITTNLILIRFIGLYAASMSTLIAYFSMMVFRYIHIQKFVKVKIDRKFIFQTLGLILILLTTYYINNFYLNIISLIITIVYAILINKNTLKSLLIDIIEKTKNLINKK